jgi:hypothetical protein
MKTSKIDFSRQIKKIDKEVIKLKDEAKKNVN